MCCELLSPGGGAGRMGRDMLEVLEVREACVGRGGAEEPFESERV
jgi:hypothetical protein